MYFPCLDDKLFCEKANMKKYLSDTEDQSCVYHSRMFMKYSVCLYWSLQHLYHRGEGNYINFWSFTHYNFFTILPSVLKGSFEFFFYFGCCLFRYTLSDQEFSQTFSIATWFAKAFNNSLKYIEGYGALNFFLYFPKYISKSADELFFQKSVV